MPQETNALPLGHQLEEYCIESILGTGGFGITYKAQDTHLEAWVAIKEYFPIEWSYRGRDGIAVLANVQGREMISDVNASGYDWGLDRFLYEARVLASIQHEFVVRVKRYFGANGTAYIVMDYEQGEPLSALLKRERTLPEADLRGLLQEVLPALEAVHQKGYLHRDLKPSNIYIRSRDGCVMLIDFGAARQSLGRHSKSVTGLVTPGYSPPEQYVTRSDRYGPWTDIYALGAVLYRCITGKPPIEAPDRQMWDSMIPAVEAGAERYSMDFLMAVDRALAMRPEDRFQTIAQMQAALATPVPLDAPSRFTLVPRLQEPDETIRTDHARPAEPLLELFDLSTPPISRPSRRSPQAPLPPEADFEAPEGASQLSEKISLPSLSIFDTGPVVSPSGGAESAAVSAAVPGELTASFGSPSAASPAATASAPPALLKPPSRRPTAAKSQRTGLEQPPVTSPLPPETAKRWPVGSRVVFLSLSLLLVLGLALLYKGFESKMAALQLEQQEAESRRIAAAEQAQREQESRRSEAARQLEFAGRAIAATDWPKAEEYLRRAEALQPDNSRTAEVRVQLQQAQRKFGSLEIRVEPLTGMKLVKINPGCFQMGSAENQAESYYNEPPRHLCVEAFWLSQYEITNAEFRLFKANHDSGSFRGLTLNDAKQPVVNVTWQEATAYADWLSRQTGQRYRLPNEAEWEYATRAGTTSIRFWGDNPDDACRYGNVADLTARRLWRIESIHNCDDGQGVAAVVGLYQPNGFRLYDMLGNVSEWTCSEYTEVNYGVEETRCSTRDRESGRRVIRGGSWDDGPKLVRSADRNGREPTNRDYDLGFRLVLER